MTDPQEIQIPQKRTPSDASEFEREQLRFLLSGDDVATTLATVNPSLAWLPILQQMQLIKNEHQLIAWVERNFSEVQAIRDVVANIHFFGPETARFLDLRLNTPVENLPLLLVRCWRLIIRAMKARKQGLLQNEWFEIAPQVKRGEHSAALLKRIAEVLQPKLRLGKRLFLVDTTEEPPESPSDLMSIDYEVDDGLSAEDVLKAWPKNADAETDARLLTQLTVALCEALEDAIDVGVESNKGYSISDTDVPSVAQHDQNTYRSGFHVIVRVMAELWLRLAKKSSRLAISLVQRWRESDFRLTRRLALFACADTAVSADFAADVLLDLPSGELFLTNSSVEVYRLIRARWRDFSSDKQQLVLRRFCEGPPRNWFREGAETDSAVDRARYDIFSDMERSGFDIGTDAKALLNDIVKRWPHWQPRPPEQAGFPMWHESGFREIEGEIGKLADVSDDMLVSEAKKLAATASLMSKDNWNALCLSDPDRALRGLDKAARDGDWTVEFWQQLLRVRKEYRSAQTESLIALLLLEWPIGSFGKIADPASSWLNEHSKTVDDALLWLLWDRIADVSLVETMEASDA